jgi:DNA-binding CsgD family transcriptional regulator/PAS domain-containing protein
MITPDNGLIGPLQNFYDYLNEGILLLNQNHETLYCNPSAKKILCLRNNNIPSRATDHLIMEPPLDSVAFITELIQKKKIHQSVQLKTCDDLYFEVELFCSCIVDDVTGEYLGQLVFFQDPFSGSESEEQFRQKAHLLNALNGCTTEVVFILDLIHRCNLFVNDAMSDLLGWHAQDFINGGWPFTLSLIHPEDIPVLKDSEGYDPVQILKAPYLDQKDSFRHSIRVKAKKGNWQSLHLNGNILEKDHNGNPYLLLLFIKPDAMVHSGIRFTQRELEIARQLVKGQSSKMIAAKFNLSVHTVNDYRAQLLKKTGTTNTAALVNYLIECKLV